MKHLKIPSQYEKTLKSNENVIAWLNKQINDKVSLGIGPRSLPSLLRNTGADMRTGPPGPYGPAPPQSRAQPDMRSSAHIHDLRNAASMKPLGSDR